MSVPLAPLTQSSRNLQGMACSRSQHEMKLQAKEKRFFMLDGFRDYMQDAAGTSRRWLHWQIIRALREVWWETDPTVLSRWSQSIIETEQRLRETTQHENFLKECIQLLHTGHDQAAKLVLPDMIEELIALDREYNRVERTYDTMLAGCPVGPIKSGYLWIRKDPQWYLKSEWLRLDCARRGGCCGRQCRCCENPPDPRRAKGWGHCTAQCACCNSERGFRMTERDRRRLKPDFDLTVYPWSEYSRQMFRAYIWSLD